MIPLFWFFIAWLACLAVFGVIALITVSIMLRFSFSALGSYVVTALFLGVTAAVLFVCGGYFMNINWSQTVNVVPQLGVQLSPPL